MSLRAHPLETPQDPLFMSTFLGPSRFSTNTVVHAQLPIDRILTPQNPNQSLHHHQFISHPLIIEDEPLLLQETGEIRADRVHSHIRRPKQVGSELVSSLSRHDRGHFRWILVLLLQLVIFSQICSCTR
ncbi:hypothetical protein Droror1_Dr00021514 [Drosera rotundifolia]